MSEESGLRGTVEGGDIGAEGGDGVDGQSSGLRKAPHKCTVWELMAENLEKQNCIHIFKNSALTDYPAPNPP